MFLPFKVHFTKVYLYNRDGLKNFLGIRPIGFSCLQTVWPNSHHLKFVLSLYAFKNLRFDLYKHRILTYHRIIYQTSTLVIYLKQEQKASYYYIATSEASKQTLRLQKFPLFLFLAKAFYLIKLPRVIFNRKMYYFFI